MKALEIESQTDQPPFTISLLFPTQRELAEAERLFDDANNRFDGTLASPIDALTDGRLEFLCHLDLGTGIIWGWIRLLGKTLLPTLVVGITSRGNVGLDPSLITGSKRGTAPIASIQSRCLWDATGWINRLQGRFSFVTVIGMIREGIAYDEQTMLIDGQVAHCSAGQSPHWSNFS